MRTKIRLGGMALSNGVLVHGPTSWACAIRTDDGEIKVASARKRAARAGIQQPFLRGPLRLAESFAVIPELRRKLPEARLPVRAAVRARRDARERARPSRSSARSPRLGDAARELLSGALVARRRRCSRSAAASWPPTTAPSTSRSARYEHGEKRAKEHERCGSHLIGPLLAASAVGNVLASRAPARIARHGAHAPARSARSASRSRCSPG